MTAAAAELLPLLLATLGGVLAGFWPGWTAAMAYARRGLRPQEWPGEEDHAAAWEAEFSAARTVTYVLPVRDRRRPDYSPSAIERWLNENPPPAPPYRAHEHADPYGAPCWCGAGVPAVRIGQAPELRALPPAAAVERCCVCGSPEISYRNYQERPFCLACADPPGPGPDELSERAATIQEIAADAEYRLTWGQLSDLARSAYDWYDITFETGEFRRIEP